LLFLAFEPWLKGLAPLLEALAGLRHVEWTLDVVGPRKRSPWRRRVHALGLEDRVHFQEAGPAPELLANADLLCLPTYRDAAGLVILEALACGTPVLTTRRAGEASLVDGEAGVVVEEPNAGLLREALAKQLERRVPDPDVLRARVAERGEAAWLRAVEARLLDLAGAPR